ncbi:MAG: flagellar motor protein MotB [Elusimicrobia bacterium]|nr:flagellar motor protein MotB [Elusimicrobiota bacterium]
MIPFLHRMSAHTVEDNPLWLIVLADMMTNLMLFFLVMFSLTLQGEPAKQQLARALNDPRGALLLPNPKAERAIQDFREEEASRALRSAFGEVRVSEDAIRVSLRERLMFRTADDRLTPDAARALHAAAEVLAQLPNTIVVEGHTDDAPVLGGPFKSNWELSVARSNSVITALVALGLPPSRLVAAGYGEHLPAASNADAAGRARNRRVEIVVLRRTPPDHE